MQSTVARARDVERDAGSDLAAGVRRAVERAQERFLALQSSQGYWHAPLEANVGMDAQYVIFNRFMDRRPQETEQRLVARMQAAQSDDGSWPLFHGGPGHLSTTIEAYFGMKLAGVSADHPTMRRARDFIRAHGGYPWRFTPRAGGRNRGPSRRQWRGQDHHFEYHIRNPPPV
jgi:squalene-hopene/tetraprenyl-beta-curcumene cyclase